MFASPRSFRYRFRKYFSSPAVGPGEQVLVHELPQHADADAPEVSRRRARSIGFWRAPADTEGRLLVLLVVAGDDVEDARDVFDRATDRARARIQSHPHHAAPA